MVELEVSRVPVVLPEVEYSSGMDGGLVFFFGEAADLAESDLVVERHELEVVASG